MMNRPLKILIATPLFPPDSGGPATDSVLLAKYLPENGVVVSVYSFGSVRHLPRGIRHIRYVYGLWKRMKDTNVIVAMDTFSVCLPVAIVARLTGTRFVIRVPGDFVWEQSVQRFGVKDSLEDFQTKRYGFRVELLRALQKIAARQADMVFTPSDFLKRVVAHWGLDPLRLKRIYLGLDFSESAILPKTAPEGNIMFSLGRLVPWKGFALLIELLPELPQWHLILAGDGPLKESLRDLARTRGVAERVTFTGTISHGEVLGWCRRADAFVLNTSFESFSYQVVEAMASEVPIITTTVGNLPEIISNGEEGVLCSPNDARAFRAAVQSVVDEPEVWKKRVVAARKKAENFTAEKSARLLLEELKAL